MTMVGCGDTIAGVRRALLAQFLLEVFMQNAKHVNPIINVIAGKAMEKHMILKTRRPLSPEI